MSDPNADRSKSDPIVECLDVSKRFAVGSGVQVHAVERVSLQIGRSETLAVVGESGCGKSTLASLVVGLERVSDGRVLLDGVDITGLSRAAMRPHRRKVQMVMQDPFSSLDPRRQVGKAVAEPLRIHKVCRGQELEDRVAELFRQVHLPVDAMRKYPHQFSGGQRQRVCIARALALEPELVVADEAVSALDVSVRAQVINVMMELQEQLGLSYLFISHDLAVVERMAHRVAVMYLGQVVEIGPRRAVLNDPGHPYTQRLIEAVPVADPSQRRRRSPDNSEIPSPIWKIGEGPQLVEFDEVSPGHLVARH